MLTAGKNSREIEGHGGVTTASANGASTRGPCRDGAVHQDVFPSSPQVGHQELQGL